MSKRIEITQNDGKYTITIKNRTITTKKLMHIINIIVAYFDNKNNWRGLNENIT